LRQNTSSFPSRGPIGCRKLPTALILIKYIIFFEMAMRLNRVPLQVGTWGDAGVQILAGRPRRTAPPQGASGTQWAAVSRTFSGGKSAPSKRATGGKTPDQDELKMTKI